MIKHNVGSATRSPASPAEIKVTGVKKIKGLTFSEKELY
jgi:hypothetical protein